MQLNCVLNKENGSERTSVSSNWFSSQSVAIEQSNLQ